MRKILVVDDDSDIRALVALKLTNAGYDVMVEGDGETGLATALQDLPDLVVLDWMMPGLTGIEVCRAMRADPRTARIAVLLLTARSRPADVERGYAAGVDDYLVKPFRGRDLTDSVHALLARVR